MATNTNDSTEYISLPSNVYEAIAMNNNFQPGNILHESALRMVRNSLKAQRACNEAIIFAYGISGAGKSSTLNHLFGLDKEKIFIEKANETDTVLVSEYTATMASEEWGVRNLEIGFIDVPGWKDTNGEYADAKNLANIEHFMVNHPYLGCRGFRCYPNILLIVIDATDKRMVGGKADLSLMMRSLSKLNIVDKTRPNVLIVLTNVMSIPEGEYTETLTTIELILRNSSKEFLGVNIEIAHIENHWQTNKLPKSGRSTILRDGILQPDNVFKAMMVLTKKYNDSVGREAIELYFKSRGRISTLICKRKSNPNDLSEDQIRKWENYLADLPFPDNEVNIALRIYAKHNLDKSFGNQTVLKKLMSELHKRKLTKMNTFANLTLNQIKEIMLPFTLNEIECEALINVCAVKPFDLTHIIDTIGCGIKADTKEKTNSSIIKFIKEFHVMAHLRLPKCMEAGASIEKIRVECKRLADPNLDGSDQTIPIPPSTGIPVKYQFQITYSIYTVKLILSDHQLLLSQLSSGFKEAVTALPESSIVEGNQVRREYVDFFNTYGHWVIVGCECGGCVEGELEMEERETMYSPEHIRTYIHNLVDRLESEDVGDPNSNTATDIPYIDVFHLIDNCRLSWNGGKRMEDHWTLKSLKHIDWISWVNSLSENALLLNSNQIGNGKVIPVSEMVALFDNFKSAEIRLAHDNIDKGVGIIFDNDFFQQLQEEITHNEESCDSYDSSISMSENDPTNRPNVERIRRYIQANNGFPGTAQLIKVENSINRLWFTPVLIDTINRGDVILCKRGLINRYMGVKRVVRTTGNSDYTFLNIEHEQGEIKMGSNQLVFISSGARISLTRARNIRLGNTIVFYNLDEQTFKRVEVINISEVTCGVKYTIEVEDNSAYVVDQILVGDDNNACFPGNASVTLRGGERVRMDELKIGDYVLSIHSTTGKPVYSKVYLWAHRDPHTTATFLHITHPHGHLHISANHLILSGDKMRPVPADQLRVGDSVHFLSPCLSQQQMDGEEGEGGDSHILISVPVLHIQTCIQVGYYAPFTNNGLIVVDDIAASVYSHISTHSQSDGSSSWLWSGVWHSVTSGLVQQFGMHRVGQCVLTPVRVGCKLGVGSMLSHQMDTNTHIHKYCQWLINVYKSI